MPPAQIPQCRQFCLTAEEIVPHDAVQIIIDKPWLAIDEKRRRGEDVIKRFEQRGKPARELARLFAHCWTQPLPNFRSLCRFVIVCSTNGSAGIT